MLIGENGLYMYMYMEEHAKSSKRAISYRLASTSPIPLACRMFSAVFEAEA